MSKEVKVTRGGTKYDARIDLEMEIGCLSSHLRRAKQELKKLGGKLTPEEVEEWKRIRGY